MCTLRHCPINFNANSFPSYEERSLGVFESTPDEDEEPAELTKLGSRKERVGKYFMWHLRRQMSIGLFIFTLSLSLLLTSSRSMVACLGSISGFYRRAEEFTRRVQEMV
jgi:hypothetical protein